ncbi:MAG TPA: ROK family protein [Bacteroidales bacterium]|nr:ROK family protein [Bacteroidales bacterium]
MISLATAIGADIGHDLISLAVVRMKGEIITRSEVRLNKKQTRDSIVSVLTDAIREIRLKAAGQGINPICIGIAAKGFIDHSQGVILGPDQGIKDWMSVPLARLIGNGTGLPTYVGNDANMMTIAEHQFGAAKGLGNIVFVALRTGIGGGLIINGKLYRGVNNAGGEIGQMIINYDNGISNLGIKGSFEHLASASAVIRRFSEESGNVYENKQISCREIFELSYSGHSTAQKVVKENAEIVGIGLANLISIFAPEMIILGGGMSQARDSYFDAIVKSAFENSLVNCRAEVRIERAMQGHDASLLGSAFYALTRLAGKNI